MLATRSLLFAHLPKTGGMWVRESIRRSGENLVEIKGIHDYPDPSVRSVLPDKTIFTVVRQPVSWWQSFWFNWARVQMPSGWEDFISPSPGTFEDYMDWVLSERPGIYSRTVYRFTLLAGRVLHTENLANELTALCTENGVHLIPLEPRNISGDQRVISPALRRAIEAAEADITDKFYRGRQ